MLVSPQSCRCSSGGYAGRCPRGRASAVLALAPLAVILADARTPAVLALGPLAVMLADARTPAVLALHWFLRRTCSYLL